MTIRIEPIQKTSLKEACIQQLESLLLAGEFIPGERLPSERDLASQLGVSRPVLHQAIVALDAKGLVQIEPRRGVFVCDFRKDGSIPLLTTLMNHTEAEYQPDLLASLMAARILIEVETARLAAENRTTSDMIELEKLLLEGRALSSDDIHGLVDYDFAIHQLVAIASNNLMYPMIINSLKSVHTNLAGEFYQAYRGSEVIDQVKVDHAKLVAAIRDRNSDIAGETMRRLLKDGEDHLMRTLSKDVPR